MNYIVYSALGEILRTGVCADSQLEIQARDGELVIEGMADDERQCIEDGQVVNLPDRPSEHHVFDYTDKTWIDPRTPETQWPLIRAERDLRLAASDWTALPDVPLDAATKAAWASYRQALRDITTQSDPFNIVWPTAPF